MSASQTACDPDLKCATMTGPYCPSSFVMFRTSAALESFPIAWKLWKSDARSTSAKCVIRERPPPFTGSSQRLCQPPQPSDTRALGAPAWKISWVARYRSCRAR